MRCGSSTRSIRYDEWPFIYWFTHCSPSSLSLQYWLTAYSWSCPLRPPSSLRSEYLVRSLRPRSSETMTRKLDLLFAYVHRSLFTVFFYFSRGATAITYRHRSLQKKKKKKLLFFPRDKKLFFEIENKNWAFPIFSLFLGKFIKRDILIFVLFRRIKIKRNFFFFSFIKVCK